MTAAVKACCFVIAFLGIVSAGVCIWVMVTPINLSVGLNIVAHKWDGGDSPKVGVATAALMLLLGIAACLANIEKRFIPFVAAVFVILIMSIAFMSLAIKDHQDWKKAKDVQEQLKTSITYGSKPYNREYGNKFKTSVKGVFIDENSLNSMMTKLKVLAAVGAIDAITSLITIIMFYVKRPKNTSRNVIQMERTL